MGEVFLDAFLDTLKVLPFLLIMNFLIELLEYRSGGLKIQKALDGGFAPLIGTAVGIVPQCGFSVVATELYSKRKIALGTLLAVYIATSDEALPIMLSSYAGLKKVLPIIIIKICFALIVGYAVYLAQKLIDKRRTPAHAAAGESVGGDHAHDHEHEHSVEHAHDHEHVHDHVHDHGHEDDTAENGGERVHIHGCHHHCIDAEEAKLDGDATKKQRAARVWNLYLKHPLLHTATVVLFILVVNVVFGITVYYVGTDRIVAFIGSTGYLQPILASAVGLIPNCAASVVITELYVVGGLSLGGAAAGLCVSAGVGYAVLVRSNKSIKNTVFIIVFMYVMSVALGVAVNLIEPLI